MTRGSMGGRERIMTNAVGNLSHLPPTALQEDLNNELNAVSINVSVLNSDTVLSFPSDV